MDFPNIIDRINTFHNVLSTTEKRDRLLTREEKNQLKHDIMSMSSDHYDNYKKEYEHIKDMSGIEYQYNRDLTAIKEIGISEKSFYNGKRNTLSDFNIDQNAMNILCNPMFLKKRNIDILKADKPAGMNLKV
jgi:hypothetical protein